MADQNFRNNELQAANPMAYLGVIATIPPNYFKIPRPPTTKDLQGYMVGDFWLDTSPLQQNPPALPTTANIWNLVAKEAGVATWVNFTGGLMSGILQIQGDSGGALNPNGSGIFFFTGGTTGLTFSGASNTETLGGVLVVSNGGTGNNTFTAYAPIIGGTSSTSPFNSAATGISNSGYVLTSTGATSAPTFQPPSGGGGSITITGDFGGSLTGSSFIFTGGSTGLIFTGTSSPNTETLSGTLHVGSGGTGAATLTGVLIGNGTSAVSGNPITPFNVLVGGASNAITSISPASVSAGNPLVSGGVSSNPLFSATPTVNKITILNMPVASTDGVNLAYVNAVASGITFITAVIAATTPSSALSAVYNNGSSGVGATLTNSGTQAAFAVDGVTLSSSQRVLIKDFTGGNDPYNGIYSVTTVGSGSTNWVLTRTTDYDTTSQILPGTVVPVEQGTINTGSSWVQTQSVSTIGTNPILFSQFSYGPSNFLQVANNLSDVASAATSRTNLGLTAVATQTVTQHDVLVGGASNAITSVTPSTAGFVLTSNGVSSDPSFQAPAAAPSFAWNVVTGSTQAMAANNGYFANNAGTVTFTLPSTPAVGDTYQVAQMSTGQTWVINYSSGQKIYIGTTSTTTGTGNLTSTADGDWVELVCRVASPAQWQASVLSGNVTPN